MSGPRVLTYAEWLQATGQRQRLVTCEECDGAGETECYHCGSLIECEECEGCGKWDETLLEYEAQRTHDVSLWQRATEQTA